MSIKGFSKPLLMLALVSSCTFTSLESLAAGQCKGFEESVCKESSDCTWVSSYTTKNGNSVSAYCRNASGKANKDANLKEERGDKTGAIDRDKPSAAKAAITKEENRG
jgi:hypothetical protein